MNTEKAPAAGHADGARERSWRRFTVVEPNLSDCDEHGSLWVSDGESVDLMPPQRRYSRHLFWQDKPRSTPPAPPNRDSLQ